MENRLITFKELTWIFDEVTPDDNYKVAANFLLEAVNDWPAENLLEPEELLSELKKEVSEKLTYDNLNKYVKSLRPAQDPWKIESLTALLELFDFNRNQNYNKSAKLEEVIGQITKHYRNKSNCKNN